jgi:hypothetical protein
MLMLQNKNPINYYTKAQRVHAAMYLSTPTLLCKSTTLHAVESAIVLTIIRPVDSRISNSLADICMCLCSSFTLPFQLWVQSVACCFLPSQRTVDNDLLSHYTTRRLSSPKSEHCSFTKGWTMSRLARMCQQLSPAPLITSLTATYHRIMVFMSIVDMLPTNWKGKGGLQYIKSWKRKGHGLPRNESTSIQQNPPSRSWG